MIRALSKSFSGWAATRWLCLSLDASPSEIANMLPGPNQGDPSFGLAASRSK